MMQCVHGVSDKQGMEDRCKKEGSGESAQWKCSLHRSATLDVVEDGERGAPAAVLLCYAEPFHGGRPALILGYNLTREEARYHCWTPAVL